MKEPEYFLDTNILLRPIVRDVPSQAKDCLKLLKKISDGNLSAVTSSLVLAELAWTLLKYYDYSKSEVASVLKGLVTAKNIKIRDRYNAALAAELYTTHHVKFVDCLIASAPDVARGKTRMVSYDRDFDKLGVKRYEPADII